MATIIFKLFSTLTKYRKAKDNRYIITSGVTVGALLNQLGVPRQIPLLIIVDEQRCDTSTKLFGGEIVSVFPPIRGG